MMTRRRGWGIRGWLVPVMVALAMGPWAAGAAAPDQLRLEPAPKEVQLREGGFRVTPATKILVQFGHQSEDRIAAETLAEEISDQSGLQLDIVGTKASTKTVSGVIMLSRLDDSRLRRFLAKNGLRADGLVGDEGYLLFSDKTHLIVAANTGQGLFYGVQTLRQLLRPEGRGLLCPAVEIRDWPSLEKTGQQRSNLTRETAPESLQRLRQEQ